MPSTLYAGVARRIINPQIGTAKCGLRLFSDPIEAIESDLTATVLVLSNEETKVAIIAMDLCTVSMPEAAAIRRQVGEAISIPPSHVMLNLSHNHSSPALPDWVADTPEQTRLKERYKVNLTQWLIESVAEAHQKLKPARVGADCGESYIGVYRRETGPGGSDVLGEVPDHPIDPAVGVIRIDDLDGNPIATMFSYGCHPVTVGPQSMVASTDFPGPARDVVENTLGGMAMFLQACGGNINPKYGIGYEVDCREAKNRAGHELGGEVLQVAANIRTHAKPGKRIPLGNVPNILFTPWESVDGNTCTYLGALEETIELEFTELPTLEEAQAIHSEWKKTLEQRQRGMAQDWEIRVATKFTKWSEKLVLAVNNGHPTLDLVAQAIRVNDIVLVGMNMEVFFETGLTVKEQSSFEHTLVLGYTNGSVAYLPRADDYPPGGWKINESYAVPDLLVQSAEMPVALRPDSERIAAAHVSALIQKLV